jgi:hypothetical protein
MTLAWGCQRYSLIAVVSASPCRNISLLLHANGRSTQRFARSRLNRTTQKIYLKFSATNFQLTIFQKVSTYAARALR